MWRIMFGNGRRNLAVLAVALLLATGASYAQTEPGTAEPTEGGDVAVEPAAPESPWSSLVPDGSGRELVTNDANRERCTIRYLPQTGRAFDCILDGGWSPILVAVFVDDAARETVADWSPAVEIQLHRIDPENSFDRVLVAGEDLNQGVISVADGTIRGFILEDLNFDGFLDYRLLTEVDPRGNHRYVGAVYDVGRDTFLPVPALEGLTRPILMPEAQMIRETFYDLPGLVRSTTYRWDRRSLNFFREAACRLSSEGLVFLEEDGDLNGRRLPLSRRPIGGETPESAMDSCIRQLDLVTTIVG